MWQSILNWLSSNAMAIFISAIASLLISKYYYDKANRENLRMSVIYPIVKILNKRLYSKENYEELFSVCTSHASKYLRKGERKKLLSLLSSYRDVCRYSEEGVNTDCLMFYYNQKLVQNSINPKPCFLKNDEDEVIDDDFPPYYNDLQNYVHKVVSSFEFFQAPDESAKKISEAFEQYTKQFYTDKPIRYFDDQSISEIIKKSKISAEWNTKFQLVDASKKDFLALKICDETIKIIDAASARKMDIEKDIEKSKPLNRLSSSINALKHTKYSSIYVVVTFFAQSVGLELLKDLPPKIWDGKTSNLIYCIGGFLLILLVIGVCDFLIKRAKKQIEAQFKQSNIKANGLNSKIDWIIEWATTVGYLSPLLLVASWVSYYDEALMFKWLIVFLVFIMGIVLPCVIKRKR